MIKQFLVLLLIPFFLVGCAGIGPRVVTDMTAFYTPNYQAKGSLFVIASEAEVNNSLEFAHYKAKFEAKLSQNGYRIVNNVDEAEFIALVVYGIDSGKTTSVTTPTYGSTGGGTTYHSGTVTTSSGGYATVSGTSYTMPTYGVIGSSSSNTTTYKRAIALDIVEADSFKKGQVKKVYEGRAVSSGSCSNMNEVFDEILEGMFTDFPAESGKSNVIVIKGEFNC